MKAATDYSRCLSPDTLRVLERIIAEEKQGIRQMIEAARRRARGE
jgi:predicted transcriptional regulator